MEARNPFEHLVPGNTGAPDMGAGDENPFASLVPAAKPKAESLIDKLPASARFALNAMISREMNKKLPLKERGQEAMASLGRGFVDVGEGAKQAYLAGKEAIGAGEPGELADYTRKAQEERDFFGRTHAGRDPMNQTLREAAASTPLLATGGALGAEAGILRKMLMSGMTNAGVGATQFMPEGQSRALNTAKYAGIGAALPLAPEVLVPGEHNLLNPTNLLSRVLKSPLSEKELMRNLEVAKGTETGLGEIIESPTAKRIQENIISKIPFTGGNETMKRTAGEIMKRGEDLVSRHLGNTAPGEVSEKLGESLAAASKAETKVKNELYAEPDKIAGEIGLQLQLPEFSNLLQQHGEDILASNIFQFEPKIKSFVTALIRGNNAKTLPLKEANIMAGKLNQMGRGFGVSASIADRNAGRILGELGSTLKNDIKTEIEASGHEPLIEAFNKAEKNYKENYSDFLEKDVLNFTHGNKLPEDLIATFLKNSKTSDKSGQLEKLLKVLPEEHHGLVRYGYLSRAMEGAEDMRVVNPNKLSTLWRNLGENQKKALFPSAAERREMDNYSMLVGKNQKAVHLMFNPMTGQVNSDLITALMLANPITSLKEIVLGRMGNKLLTGEQPREAIVKKLIERLQKKGAP